MRPPNVKHLFVSFCTYLLSSSCFCDTGDAEQGQNTQRFMIEGKVSVPFSITNEWLTNTRIIVDGGIYLGFLKSDGSFTISVPSGSYTVEVANPVYMFEPARVDVNSKGKMRARRLDYLQPGVVQQLTYPLKLKAKGKAAYFQQREQLRITDLLMNPMVLMMVLPCLMIMVLPKLMNSADPEAQKEMQNSMNFLNPKQKVPDLSEMVTNLWYGGSDSSKKTGKKKEQKRLK